MLVPAASRDALSKTNDKVRRPRLSAVGRCVSSVLVRVGRPPLPEMFLPRAAHSRTMGGPAEPSAPAANTLGGTAVGAA